MVKVKDTYVFIGDDIYKKLPKAEQKKFKELDRYYKMCEWAEYMELDPETGEEIEYHEWGGDKCFKDIEDLRDFFVMMNVGLSVEHPMKENMRCLLEKRRKYMRIYPNGVRKKDGEIS